MPTWTDTDTNLTWNYTLDSDNNASIGDGSDTDANATVHDGVDLTGGRWLVGHIIIPDTVDTYTVTGIGKKAFKSANIFLTSITLPDTITTIGERAFENAWLLESINFPDTITSIGQFAFEDAWVLTEIDMASTEITMIDRYTFLKCTALKSVKLPDTLTNIKIGAFTKTKNLETINIPSSIPSVTWAIHNQSFDIDNTVTNTTPEVTIYNNQVQYTESVTDANIVQNNGVDEYYVPSPKAGIWFFGRTVNTELPGVIQLDPPVVTFPTTSPTTDGTVTVIQDSDATSWRYSLDAGSTWITGTNTSFIIPLGTYAIDSIQVDNSNTDPNSTSDTVKNTAQIIVGTEFTTTAANAKKTDLVTLINGLAEVKVVKEIYKIWYESTQNYGGTDVWVYYVYEAAADDSIIYNTRKFQFNPDTESWTVSSPYVNASDPVSVSSDGLTSTDLTNYIVLYEGLDPFQMDVSTTSLTSLKSVYDSYRSASTFPWLKISEVYNIWYDNRDIFTFNYGVSFTSNTRNVDAWLYISTSGLVVKSSVRVATTDNGDLSSSFENGKTVDDIILNTDDRILIKNQTTESENGIYTVNTAGAPTRADGSNYYSTDLDGAYTFVEDITDNEDGTASVGGTVNNNKGFVGTATGTSINFTEYSEGGTDGSIRVETRKVMYTITDDNATYEWTIPTNDTVLLTTITNTQYNNIPDSSNFVLSYFYFDAYTITNEFSLKNLKSIYRTYFSENKLLSTVNELWYDKSKITPGDTIYDTSYNDTGLTIDNIDLILYGIKQDLDAAGIQSNTEWTKINITYSKKTRNWSIVGTDSYASSINSGIADNISVLGYKQTLSNILYYIYGKVDDLTLAYNNSYDPDITTLIKLWISSSPQIVDPMFILFSTLSGETFYTTAIYDRVIDSWSFNNAVEDYNSMIADTILYSEFSETELEGKQDNIKRSYAEAAIVSSTLLDVKSIVTVHNVWYNTTTTNNTTIECKMYHSYNDSSNDTKLYFGIVDLTYDTQLNIDNYSVVGTTFVSQNYDYDGNTALPVDYNELSSYTTGVLFDIDTSAPIMLGAIKGQFDASYNEVYNTSLTINIHNVWVTTGTGTSIMSYTTPIQDMYVYYSLLNSSNDTEYKSRKLTYDLQLNVWGLTSSDTITAGTIRTSGLTTAELTPYTKIFEFLPETPVFSSVYASSGESLTAIKTVYLEFLHTDILYNAVELSALEIYKLWYLLADSNKETVKCIVYLSITYVINSIITTGYKTFQIIYNNDTNVWALPTPTSQENSTATDDKFSSTISAGDEVADYFMFYSLPSGPSVSVLKDEILMTGARHLHLPVGSILMYHKKTISLGTAFLLCDGAQKNITDYPELAAVLNYKYGGNGSSLFNVPNLSDRFPIGANSVSDTNIVDDTVHTGTNRTGGSWNISSEQFSHTHPSVSYRYINGLCDGSNKDNEGPSSSADWIRWHTPTVTMTQGGTAHKPPFFVVNYVIYTGRGTI
jgi:microcystin-dependent protein